MYTQSLVVNRRLLFSMDLVTFLLIVTFTSYIVYCLFRTPYQQICFSDLY